MCGLGLAFGNCEYSRKSRAVFLSERRCVQYPPVTRGLIAEGLSSVKEHVGMAAHHKPARHGTIMLVRAIRCVADGTEM
jgi:hypothetical protein